MKKFLILTLAIVLTLAAPGALLAQKYKTPAPLKKEMRSFFKRNGAVGVMCAVVKDNRIVYVGEFGALDTLGTRFCGQHDEVCRLASVSKSYAATAVMCLVDDGKINLDDDVQKYLGIPVRNPKYPDDPITVRMFLNHSSSIRDVDNVLTLATLDPARNDEWYAHYMDYKPGTHFKYSNLCYNLVASIVEAASGERFDRFCNERILKPLGLNASWNPADLDSTKFVPLWQYDKNFKHFKRMPASYKGMKNGGKGYRLVEDANQFVACGGMKTDIVSLARYMMMHMGDGQLDGVRIISEESSRLMKTGTIVGDETAGVKRNYGLGLSQYEPGTWVPGKPVTGHRGSIKGLGTNMHFNQEEGWGICTICNGFTTSSEVVSHELVRILYKVFIEEPSH